MSGIKTSFVDRDALLFTPESEKRPGLFHVIDPDGRIGWRQGLILERAKGKTFAAMLLLSACSQRKEWFTFDFGRQRALDYRLHYIMARWESPAWYRDARGFSMKKWLGSISVSAGSERAGGA